VKTPGNSYFFTLVVLLLASFFIPTISKGQPTTPIEIVQMFDKCYGTASMDDIPDYTTPKFRDNKPKSVWVVDTWNTLKDIKYERLASSMVNSRINEDKAIVVYEVKIKTAAGETSQKEIYFLIKEDGKWLIDDLVVTDEEIDLEKLEL
jgi:hypothetical protein